jgi:hypothetical protein
VRQHQFVRTKPWPPENTPAKPKVLWALERPPFRSSASSQTERDFTKRPIDPFKKYVHPKKVFCEYGWTPELIERRTRIDEFLTLAFRSNDSDDKIRLEFVRLGGMEITEQSETEKFIEKFFVHGGKYDTDDYGSFHMHSQLLECNYDLLKRYSEVMLYEDFLKTLYWGITSRAIRERAKFQCERCYSKRGELHIHHLTYDHLGSELHFDQDLVCLCQSCHRTVHSKNN